MIPCIHDGEKTKISIKYQGEEKNLEACPDCVKVIKSSNICEVLP